MQALVGPREMKSRAGFGPRALSLTPLLYCDMFTSTQGSQEGGGSVWERNVAFTDHLHAQKPVLHTKGKRHNRVYLIAPQDRLHLDVFCN